MLILVLGIITTLVGVVFVNIIHSLAVKFKLNDHPDEIRKLHETPIPTSGGIAIGSAFYVGVFITGWVMDLFPEHFLTYLIIGSLIIFITGIYDDIYGLSSKPKFFLQFVATIITITGFHETYLLEFEGYAEGGILFRALIWTILGFWIISCTNIINLIDGVDGLAGTVSQTILVGLGGIALVWGQYNILFIIVILSASIAAFLFFNKPPAIIFMGDTGSLFIGYMLACITLIIASDAPHWKLTLSLPLLMSVPGIDTLFSIIRRVKNGINPFESDHSHIHHILQKYFRSPALTDITLGTVSLILVSVSILLANSNSDILYFTILGMYFSVLLVVTIVYFIKMDSINSIVGDDLTRKKQDREIRKVSELIAASHSEKSSAENMEKKRYIKTYLN